MNREQVTMMDILNAKKEPITFMLKFSLNIKI